MRTRRKIITSTVALAIAFGFGAPAAQAAEYWASASSPSNVRNDAGKVLGQAYGRGYNSTINVINRATYKRVSGSYGIYVSSGFYFYQYNTQSKQTEWMHNVTYRHPATSGTSWYATSRSTSLSPRASQSRVVAHACTDVPFLVPGNCTGNHILTNSY